MFSIGDVVMSVGAFLCLHTLADSRLSTRRRRRAAPAPPAPAPAVARPADPLLRAVVGVVVVGATLASTRGRRAT